MKLNCMIMNLKNNAMNHKPMTGKAIRWIAAFLLTGSFLQISAQIKWSPGGPVYTAGRARNLLVDRSDGSNKTMYAGSIAGGVFVSHDEGANWEPVNDQSPVKNISYLAQSADNTIYVATGESFIRPGTRVQLGTGLYKISNSNLVLVADSSVTGAFINRVACSPANANVIALATNKGILVSKDAGASFNTAVFSTMPTTVNLTIGMDVKFDAAGTLYCSIGHHRGDVPYDQVSSKVFKSSGVERSEEHTS